MFGGLGLGWGSGLGITTFPEGIFLGRENRNWIGIGYTIAEGHHYWRDGFGDTCTWSFISSLFSRT